MAHRVLIVPLVMQLREMLRAGFGGVAATATDVSMLVLLVKHLHSPVALATFLARALILASTYMRGLASVRTLRAASCIHGEVQIVESDRAFCFVTRGGVFVSSPTSRVIGFAP